MTDERVKILEEAVRLLSQAANYCAENDVPTFRVQALAGGFSAWLGDAPMKVIKTPLERES